MQFCRAGGFGELFGTLAKDVPGGVAPAAKCIHHQGGELPAATNSGVQAPCRHGLIQNGGEVLAFCGFYICNMASGVVCRTAQGPGGRLHRVRSADIAEKGGPPDPCGDENISLTFSARGVEQACP